MHKAIPLFMVMLTGFAIPSAGWSAGDLTRQTPIAVQVDLGTKTGELVFAPEDLVFETGKLYQLVLHNPSDTKHYFSSETLARSVFTRKTQVLDAAGKTIAEIKGNIREIEVLPGGTAEWWFVPVATAKASDLKCTIKGHAEAGMTGTIEIR